MVDRGKVGFVADQDGKQVLEIAALGGLLDALKAEGYLVIGPTVRDNAIVYEHLDSADQLPTGWKDVQDGGTYRLEPRDDAARFGYAVGPHSWKKFLFPPRLMLWRGQKNAAGGFDMAAPAAEPPRYAFIGVRSCDLHAIAIQDRVFTAGAHTDPYYKSVRDSMLVVALNCGQAAGTCFCVSMNTGPRATFGYDIALTEVIKDGEHYLLAESGTDRGAEILEQVQSRPATGADVANAEDVVQATAGQMGRVMDTSDIKDLLYRNHEHPRWDNVADRCLTCANCTLVCPTCFCSTVEDATDATGRETERHRRWDSCFTMDFSYIHGGSVRSSGKSRYRQWMTHKLASWIDQFGTSGCVGCGRCITWCPVGIDITEEVRAIRESESAGSGAASTEPEPQGDQP
jgi:sulfhydrogenase subunit beta (sulfur reductase)